MRTRETITLSDVGDTAEYVLRLLSPTYPFERSGSSLILHQDYCRGAYEDIEQKLTAAKVRPKLFQNIYPEFDDADYSGAPLLNVAFPDLSISGMPLVYRCPVCERRRTAREYATRVSRVNSAAPALSVNGTFDILSFGTLKQLERVGLRGMENRPFDEEGQYFYLSARTELGELIIHPGETRGYRGHCPACAMPRFEVYFGPFRFSRSKWSGDDFVWAELIDRVVVSQRAYAELIRMETGVMKLSPVMLE
jgi:hypothetical protein